MKALLLLPILLLSAVGFAQKQKLEKPGVGSKLRKAVLDGLRPKIEKDLNQKVVFKVREMRVYGDWAYVSAQPVQPNLKVIDFTKTRYKENIDQGVFDGDSLYALLKRSNKKWITKDFIIGPTDVYWSNWMGDPWKAPKTLFPPPFGPK